MEYIFFLSNHGISYSSQKIHSINYYGVHKSMGACRELDNMQNGILKSKMLRLCWLICCIGLLITILVP